MTNDRLGTKCEVPSPPPQLFFLRKREREVDINGSSGRPRKPWHQSHGPQDSSRARLAEHRMLAIGPTAIRRPRTVHFRVNAYNTMTSLINYLAWATPDCLKRHQERGGAIFIADHRRPARGSCP